jgi:hypothetical protein
VSGSRCNKKTTNNQKYEKSKKTQEKDKQKRKEKRKEGQPFFLNEKFETEYWVDRNHPRHAIQEDVTVLLR